MMNVWLVCWRRVFQLDGGWTLGSTLHVSMDSLRTIPESPRDSGSAAPKSFGSTAPKSFGSTPRCVITIVFDRIFFVPPAEPLALPC